MSQDNVEIARQGMAAGMRAPKPDFATVDALFHLPLGMGSDGLPIGVMLAAQTLREDLLMRVAAQLEHAMPWADRRPRVAAGQTSRGGESANLRGDDVS